MTLNNINGIGIGLNTSFQRNEATTEVEENLVQNNAQTNSAANLIPQEEVLSVFEQQAALNKLAINAPKAYDVEKYITPESAQRIAASVVNFENNYAQNLDFIDAEFGASLSEADRMNLALFATDKMVS